MRGYPRLWQPDFPFRPNRVPFFYGWVILLATSIGIIMSLPGQTMGVSVFTEIFMERLELSRVQLSLAYLLGTTASGFLLPYGGVLLDRFGARKMIVFASGAFGVTLMGIGHCDQIAHALRRAFLADRLWWISFVVITAFFFGIRFLGQGMVTVTSRATLGKWFDRRRGITLAISGVMISFAFSASPRLLDAVNGAIGWRTTYFLLGTVLIAGMCTFGWLLFRDNPEECGLEMDGGAASAESGKPNRDRLLVRDMTRSEALRTFSFWAFNLGTAWQALVITAYTFHVVSIGEEAGISRPEILGMFLPMAGIGVGVNFLAGWIGDRTRASYVLVMLTGGLALAGFGMLWLKEPAGRVLLIAGLGFSGGTFQTALGLVWPRFYGRKHLGAISGFNMSTIVLASAVGPFVFSLAKQYFGGYQAAYLSTAIIPIVLTVAAFFARNPQERLLGESPRPDAPQ